MLAVVFDLDDTLYPEVEFNIGGFRAVGEYAEERSGDNRLGDACIALYESGVRHKIFDSALASLDLDLSVDELVEVYRNHRPRITLFEDAHQALQAVASMYPMALLTDGYAAVQRRKIAALGIAHLFDTIVISDELGGRSSWKPSRLPYQKVMSELSDVADSYVYVADNPSKDFLAARALGWHTIMISRPTSIHRSIPQPGHSADRVVTSLLQIRWSRLGSVRSSD